MIQGVLTIILHMLASIAAVAVLVLGFAFLIFLGDADARGRPLVSAGFDKLAAIVVYLSWFGLLWWFGFSRPLLVAACAATSVLCLIYAASYRSASSRQPTSPDAT